MLDKIYARCLLYREMAAYTFILMLSVLLLGYAISDFWGIRTYRITTIVAEPKKRTISLRALPAVPLQSVKESAGPTVLDQPPSGLSLTGILYSSNNEHSRAILKGPEGQKSYAHNVNIDGYQNASIKRIYPSKVILFNAGKEYTLQLQSLTKKAQADDEQTYSQEAITLRKYITPTIIYGSDKSIIGLRLHNNVSPAVFRQVGLAPGDIAIKLNNRNLQDRENVDLAIQELSQLRTIEMTLIQDNQQKLVKVSVEDFIKNMDVK